MPESLQSGCEGEEYVFLLVARAEDCRFCLLAERAPTVGDVLNIKEWDYNQKPASGVYRIDYVQEKALRKGNFFRIDIRVRREGPYLPLLPVQEAMLVST